MAFRRRYVRRSTRPRRSSRRSTTRRTVRKTYRTRRRRTMAPRRAILNIASKKKQDNMAPTVATTSGTSPVPGPFGYGAFGATGAIAPGLFIWCATARDRLSTSGLADSNASSVRTSDTCYMRGLKERVLLQTNTQVPWRWRRICFTSKGLQSQLGSSVDSLETSNGWVRLLANYWGTAYGTAVQTNLFKGSQGIDWLDVMTAKVDTSRVTVKYDVTRTINSGNGTGCMRSFRMWHPMNKNLVYANDEQGESETQDTHSTLGKAGMGDYYVVDFFLAAGFATRDDGISFNTEATLYWHEK